MEGVGADVGEAADRPRHGAGPRRKDKIVKGLTERRRVPVQEEQDRLDQGQRPAGRPATVEVTDGQKQTLAARKEIIVATGSPPRSVPGHRDRSQADHHQRRSDRPEGGAEVDRDHGQRRRRRRVRLDLPPLRQRGDDHRAAAAARAGRGRSGVGRARAVFKKQGIKVHDRHQGDVRESRRRRRRRRGRRLPDGKTEQAEGGIPAGRDRTRSGDDGSGRGGGRARDRARLHQGRRAVPHQRRRHFGDRRRDHVRQAGRIRSWRTCRRRKASSLAERIAGQDVRPINYDQVPGCTYCDPGNRQRRPDREGGAGARLRRHGSARSRSASSAAPGWPARPKASSRSSPTRNTTRCSACT